ncbi:hypothetical protein ABIC66_002725 [Caulobacter sp. 1776]
MTNAERARPDRLAYRLKCSPSAAAASTNWSPLAASAFSRKALEPWFAASNWSDISTPSIMESGVSREAWQLIALSKVRLRTR